MIHLSFYEIKNLNCISAGGDDSMYVSLNNTLFVMFQRERLVAASFSDPPGKDFRSGA
jgi:hypothetical protein